MPTRANPGIFPTEEQLLLLRAALWSGGPALHAWEVWKDRVNIEQIDHGSARLLPLVYGNLRQQLEHDPLLGKLKGTYRLTWYKNQVHLHSLAAALRTLGSAGTRTIVLKGIALASLYYQDLGLRPVGDLDVLVPEGQARQAMEQLSAMGWTLKGPSLQSLQPEVFRVRKDLLFVDARGNLIDLHWHLLPQRVYPGADDSFWSGAETTELLGVPTYILNPSDQLLHVVEHGLVWGIIPLIRWVADAMWILRERSQDVNWDRLIEQAQRHHLVLPVRDGLEYLRDQLQAPIPQEFLDEIQSLPISRLDRLEHQVSTRPRHRVGLVPLLWVWHRRHLERTGQPGSREEKIGFVRYVQHFWLLDNVWQVPRHVARKAWRKLQRSTKALLGIPRPPVRG